MRPKCGENLWWELNQIGWLNNSNRVLIRIDRPGDRSQKTGAFARRASSWWGVEARCGSGGGLGFLLLRGRSGSGGWASPPRPRLADHRPPRAGIK